MDDRATCCGRPTSQGRTAIRVDAMQNPPRTTDRWYLTWSYQCMITEDHRGTWHTTTDDLEGATRG